LTTGAVWTVVSAIPEPAGLAVTPAGDLLICAPEDHVIYKFSGGALTVAAELEDPRGVVVEPSGELLVADGHGHRVVRVKADGMLQTIVGTDAHGWLGDGGDPLNATLCHPVDLTLTPDRLLITDWVDGRIRTIPAGDTTPPAILAISVDVDCLWPPNHKLREVNVTIVTDDPAAVVQLISAVSSEPDDGLGDGDTANDIQGGGTQLLLRAERAVSRIYTMTYVAVDPAGNVSPPAVVTVCVPHSKP
jgi:hypothetical protein